MKNFKAFISVLASINAIGAVVCLILMFAAKSKGDTYWPMYIALIVSLFINALAFAFIADLGDRLDKVEDVLKQNGLSLKEKKKEIKPQESQKVFRAGEPIRLKNEVVVGWKKYVSDLTGMVLEVKDNNTYVVEFDKDRGNKVEINGDDLKSYFDK